MSTTNLRVGFIGMGIMGGSMAANVLKAGFPLTVYNRSAHKTKPLQDAGASVAPTPRDLATNCDIILSCVTADKDVLDVLLNESSGVIAGVQPGSTVIDCSTVSPQTAKCCAAALAQKGCGFLDAPVSGGDVGARQGTLSIMVGGDKSHFDKALPIFNAMGKTVTLCGHTGAGYTVKLCNQILGGLHLIAAAEAVKLAAQAGIDLTKMLQAVSSGAAGSWILSNLAPRMVSGDFKPGFFIEYQLKDLRLANEAAEALHIDLPATELATQIFTHACEIGLGRSGTAAIIKAI